MTTLPKITSPLPKLTPVAPPSPKPAAPTKAFASVLAKPKWPAIGPSGPTPPKPPPPKAAPHPPAATATRKPTKEREHEKDDAPKEDEPLAPPMFLDPMARMLSAQTPITQPIAPPNAPMPAPAVDELVHRFLKRFAMSGDRVHGTAHLELAHGELAGGSITLTADRGQVHINVQGPPGVDTSAIEAALEKRLAARGLSVSVR